MSITAIGFILIAVMFIWRSKISRIRRRFILLAAIPLLSLLSLYTPFFVQPAAAVSSADVMNAARAWSILNAVLDQASRLDSTISNADADNCHIFGNDDNDLVYVGHHVTENSDSVGAFSPEGSSWQALEGRVDLAKGALSYLVSNGGSDSRFNNGCRGLLEILGYTSSGGDMHQPRSYSNGDGEVLNRLKGAVKGDPFFGAHMGDGTPGDAISYVMLYYALTKVCGWEYRNAYVENDSSGSADQSRNREAQNNGWGGDSTNSHFHTYTYENSKAGENTYYKGGGRTDDINVGSRTGFANSGANNAEIDCGNTGNGDIVGAKLHDNHRYADAYANLVKPGGQFTPGTCGEKYPGAQNEALRNACDEGFRNKTPGYCDKFNSNQPQKDACLYGQSTATGGATDVTPPEEKDEKTVDKTTCALPGIGWIVCPVMNLVAKIVDGAYGFVATLLTVRPVTTDTGSGGLFKAWSIMRNFANVAFVIAFLIIIFSQVTSMGVSNYGIKRLLPRLVIAAILVNASFWVCSIAVDLSNIAGSSIYGLFQSIKQGITLPTTSGYSTADQWQGIVGTLLAGTLLIGAALFIGLAALIPILLACLIAIVIVVIILVIRQALVILLIVISPLAFVAYLLPNTESLFTKWRKLFGLMLLLYPIISLIFGASALASKIIMGS